MTKTDKERNKTKNIKEKEIVCEKTRPEKTEILTERREKGKRSEEGRGEEREIDKESNMTRNIRERKFVKWRQKKIERLNGRWREEKGREEGGEERGTDEERDTETKNKRKEKEIVCEKKTTQNWKAE